MEIVRRVVLLCGIFFGPLFFFWVPSGTLVEVRAVDVRIVQKNYGGAFASHREQLLRKYPPIAFARYIAGEKAGLKQGQQCTKELSRVVYEITQPKISSDLQHRMSEKFGHSLSGTVYLRVNELPADCSFPSPNTFSRKYLLVSEEPLIVGEVSLESSNPDNFMLGSGYKGYPQPPAFFLYPLRKSALILMAACAVIYFFLPAARVGNNILSYRRYGMVGADITGGILCGVFLFLSFGIAQNTMTMVSQFFFLSLLLWALAMMGMSIILMTLSHASQSIEPTKEGIYVKSLFSRQFIPYSEIVNVTIDVKRPPKWLRYLLCFSGAASGNLTLMGQAAMQMHASSGWLALDIRGNEVGFWITNQLGGLLLNNLDSFLERLKEHGVEGADNVLSQLFEDQ